MTSSFFGISGGTIALITGIYERLLSAIVAADAEAVALLLRGRWRALWFRLDGAFLAVLLCGILTAIFSMASGIHWLLSHYPQPLWAFFSGLILKRRPLEEPVVIRTPAVNRLRWTDVFSYRTALVASAINEGAIVGRSG